MQLFLGISLIALTKNSVRTLVLDVNLQDQWWIQHPSNLSCFGLFYQFPHILCTTWYVLEFSKIL